MAEKEIKIGSVRLKVTFYLERGRRGVGSHVKVKWWATQPGQEPDEAKQHVRKAKVSSQGRSIPDALKNALEAATLALEPVKKGAAKKASPKRKAR